MRSGLPQTYRLFIRMWEQVLNQHAILTPSGSKKKKKRERDKSGTNKESNGKEPKRWCHPVWVPNMFLSWGSLVSRIGFRNGFLKPSLELIWFYEVPQDCCEKGTQPEQSLLSSLNNWVARRTLSLNNKIVEVSRIERMSYCLRLPQSSAFSQGHYRWSVTLSSAPFMCTLAKVNLAVGCTKCVLGPRSGFWSYIND